MKGTVVGVWSGSEHVCCEGFLAGSQKPYIAALYLGIVVIELKIGGDHMMSSLSADSHCTMLTCCPHAGLMTAWWTA